MFPVHNFPPYFPKIHCNVIFSFTPSLTSGLFPSGFPTKILYALLVSPMCATFSIHLIILYLITLITLGEAYKLWSSSLCRLASCFAHKVMVPSIQGWTQITDHFHVMSYFQYLLCHKWQRVSCTTLQKVTSGVQILDLIWEPAVPSFLERYFTISLWVSRTKGKAKK